MAEDKPEETADQITPEEAQRSLHFMLLYMIGGITSTVHNILDSLDPVPDDKVGEHPLLGPLLDLGQYMYERAGIGDPADVFLLAYMTRHWMASLAHLQGYDHDQSSCMVCLGIDSNTVFCTISQELTPQEVNFTSVEDATVAAMLRGKPLEMMLDRLFASMAKEGATDGCGGTGSSPTGEMVSGTDPQGEPTAGVGIPTPPEESGTGSAEGSGG